MNAWLPRQRIHWNIWPQITCADWLRMWGFRRYSRWGLVAWEIAEKRPEGFSFSVPNRWHRLTDEPVELQVSVDYIPLRHLHHKSPSLGVPNFEDTRARTGVTSAGQWLSSSAPQPLQHLWRCLCYHHTLWCSPFFHKYVMPWSYVLPKWVQYVNVQRKQWRGGHDG